MADIAEDLELVARWYTTLDGLERMSLEEVEELWLFIEWREEQQAKLEEKQRREAEAQRQKR